ncbi:unnamed protein product [Paramecium primaurelia]|uniref:Uncharacterized protein n=1 Tax=Paramecium primaurelia TaxID=5886 RepID=A0A8S1PF82_PARPR|nr:unnamed protein product [Paramecium primaurelia]
MGCSMQKHQSNRLYLKNNKKRSLQNQTQDVDQSKQQITKSPPTSSKPLSPLTNSKQLSQQQQIKIQDIIFTKKRNSKQTTLLKVDEQYQFQQTLIGLIKK